MGWYRRTAQMPDVLGSRSEAEALLRAPYRAPPRATPPESDTLASYAGTYLSPAIGALEVRFVEGGLEAISQATGLRSYLCWRRGSEFDMAANESITLEFIRDRGVTAAVLRIAGREFALTRKG